MHLLGVSRDITATILNSSNGHELSCWERHLLQANSGRLAA